MKVLVTGGAGFVGSTLVGHLLGLGYEVRVLDNLMYGGRSLLPYFAQAGFEFVRGDVRAKEDVLRAVAGVDAIIHLAAIVGYPACKRDEQLAHDVNRLGAANVESTTLTGMPLVFASTGSVYGVVESGHCTEETPPSPVSTYSETKLAAEKHMLGNGRSVVLRFATGFGVSPRMRLDTVVNAFCYQAKKTGYLVVYEKAHRRTFIHVTDMARSLIFALDNYSRMAGQVYNVGDESMNVDKAYVARAIQQRIDYFLHYAEIGSDGDKRNYEVSFEKIRRLGFKTSVTVEQGIDELLAAMDVIDVRHEFMNV